MMIDTPWRIARWGDLRHDHLGAASNLEIDQAAFLARFAKALIAC
jgi:hypothetical protein